MKKLNAVLARLVHTIDSQVLRSTTLYSFRDFKLQLVKGLTEYEAKQAYMGYVGANRARAGLSHVEASIFYGREVSNNKIYELLQNK